VFESLIFVVTHCAVPHILKVLNHSYSVEPYVEQNLALAIETGRFIGFHEEEGL